MATQHDLQDLLRILTSGRNKISMLAAMGRVKALQAADLRSVAAIASADIATICKAIPDAKAAKQLQTAAKNNIKSSTTNKRSATFSIPDTKRKRSQYELVDEPQTSQEFEASLVLPQPSLSEEEISESIVTTNRAPLVLAFALQLLKYTMPEQPLSSRLSLAQAVVSVNSRSKAVSIGIMTGNSAEQEGWGSGQPTVKVMGRGIQVLKRGGYEWTEPDLQESLEPDKSGGSNNLSQDSAMKLEDEGLDSEACGTPLPEDADIKPDIFRWATSQSVTLKKSTFVARSIGVTSASDARSRVSGLLARHQELREASHNITAFRIISPHGDVIEDSDDDGESGGGRHVLSILRSMNLTNVVVVVTRWYGGIFLSTDRWRLIGEVVRDAVSQRLRVAGILGQEALWGLDLEGMRSTNAPVTGGTASGMPIYKPEGARAYVLKAFASAPTANRHEEIKKEKKKTGVELEREKERNLGLVLGALDLLYSSWVEHLGRDELDRRAWGWYVQVRPDVETGVAGWGSKGNVRLVDILNLRRRG